MTDKLTIADYEEVLADKRRLTRELDIALHGEAGAAKQASLCDLIEPARRLRADIEALRTELSLTQAVKIAQSVEIERLRAVLKPFAEAADNYEKPHELLPAAPDVAKIGVGDLTVADLRRARDALAHEQRAQSFSDGPGLGTDDAGD